MEWREHSRVSCVEAFNETQRWIEEVTSKSFGTRNFRAALEDGVLLCDLINKLKPGIIKRLNRLSTPIAGLDNVNVFLKACAKLGLNESQRFDPGDLQDLSSRVTLGREECTRRQKNVLNTIYWLGRKAQLDPFYAGSPLNLKAFEGLLGLALSKALEEGISREVPLGESWRSEKESFGGIRPGLSREDSVDSLDSLDRGSLLHDGCGSDAEADQVIGMAKQPPAQRERGSIPSALLHRKRGREVKGRVCPLALTRSKSTNDLLTEAPRGPARQDVGLAGGRSGELPQGAGAKEGEEEWQQDLTKWKNRRRSTNSDIRRKFQERGGVNDGRSYSDVNDGRSYSGVNDGRRYRAAAGPTTKTPNGHQLARLDVLGSSPSTSPTSKSCRQALQPPASLLALSHAAETLPAAAAPCGPLYRPQKQVPLSGAMPASPSPLLAEEPPVSSLAHSPYSTQTQEAGRLRPALSSGAAGSGLVLSEETTGPASRARTVPILVPGLTHQVRPPAAVLKVTFLHGPFKQGTGAPLTWQKHKSPHSTEERPLEEGWGLGKAQHDGALYRTVSASLPRGYPAVLTPTPFGTKPSRVSSLPRFGTGNDSKTLPLSADDHRSLQPGLSRQVATSHIRAPRQAAIGHASGNQEVAKWVKIGGEQEGSVSASEQAVGNRKCLPHFLSNSQATSLPPPANQNLPQERRVCLSVKPNSISDFGFQTDWNSAGTTVQCVQQADPTELCQQCADDDITAVDGITDHMTCDQWKSTVTSDLQAGRITMETHRQSDQGGTDSAISDLQVPSLTPSPSGWFWDHEEERRRQERWQEEQERLLQDQYQRDQERLQAEWQRAQEEAVEEEKRPSEEPFWQVNAGVVIPSSAPVVTEDGLALKKASETHSEATSSKPGRRESEKDMLAEQERSTGSGGFSQLRSTGSGGFSQLSPAHRVKSKSNPTLMDLHKKNKGPGEPRKRKVTSVSKAEQDRQQILEEMKKRTQLLTDSSWIRTTRSSNICTQAHLRRYESLDNLHSGPPWELGPCPRPCSAAGRSASPLYCLDLGFPRQHPSSTSSHDLLTDQQEVSHGLPVCQEGGSVWAIDELNQKSMLESEADGH